jgi:hypothetical protein
MPETLKTLRHDDIEDRTDDELRAEARTFLGRSGALQLIAELVGKLRAASLPWWSPEFTRATWGASARFRWLAQRPDLRQAITTRLTGLPPRTARTRPLEVQAQLVDTVLEQGDVDCAKFEEAFDPADMAVYGPAHEFWFSFMDRMPWEEDTTTHQRLVAWAIRAMISERGLVEGTTRRPILTATDVRASIPTRVWQTKIPAETRAAVDEARLRLERARPREPYHARHELTIVTPEIIAANIPLAELVPVFAAAEQAMGLSASRSTSMQPSPSCAEDATPSSTEHVTSSGFALRKAS